MAYAKSGDCFWCDLLNLVFYLLTAVFLTWLNNLLVYGWSRYEMGIFIDFFKSICGGNDKTFCVAPSPFYWFDFSGLDILSCPCYDSGECVYDYFINDANCFRWVQNWKILCVWINAAMAVTMIVLAAAGYVIALYNHSGHTTSLLA